jgi:alpha-galactosidase-like protein/carbohydrate binding protein with CBM6 domain
VADSLQKPDASGHLTLGVDYRNGTDAYLVTLLRPGVPTAFDGTMSINGSVPAAGATSTVVTTFRNTSTTAAETAPTQQLSAPAGWTVEAVTSTVKDVVRPGESFDTAWTVTAPAGAAGSSAMLTASTIWKEDGAPKGAFTTTAWQRGTVPCGLGQVCELEQGTLRGGACTATDHPGYTGSGFIACFVSQQVQAPATGTYTATLRYAAGPDGPATDRTLTVSVNGGTPQLITLPRTGSWNTWGSAATALHLDAGVNTLTYADPSGATGWVNLDSVTVTP